MFKGIYTALFSIYDENLKVKKDSVKSLIEYNLKNGINGFYVGGATGECVVLPNRTRIEMLETVMEYKKDCKIIAHIGAGHFDDTKDLVVHANSLNVDAIASLPPALTDYYNENETINYYKIISSLTDKPLMAYIQPFYSGNVTELISKLLEIKNFIGIKLTVPNYYLFEQLRRNFPEINILNGPDESVLAGLVSGANGAIGTSYNLLPKAASNLYNSVINGDIKAAQENQHIINRLIDVVLGKGIVCWKELLRYIDIDPGFTVEPAIAPDAEMQSRIKKLLESNGTIAEMTKYK